MIDGAAAGVAGGAAISGLSGVAATNATLAWLGGGTLASGGLGIAGGVAALTGIFLAPTLIGCWWYMGSKAEKNLKNARENLAKANKFSADIKAAITLTEKINKIAEKAIFVLSELKEYLGVVLDQLKNVIKGQGINYDEYSLDAKQIVLTNVKIIQLIKAVLDTQILDKDDHLMGDSESNLLKIEDQINKLVGQKNYCLKQLPC